MRDPERIEPMLQYVEQFWKKHPDWRLGQVMVNIVRTAESTLDLFYVEDAKLMALLAELDRDLERNHT